MLAHTDWDFYFNRSERDVLLDRLRTRESSPRGEVCLKRRNGAPIWILARRTVAIFVNGLPELLQETLSESMRRKKLKQGRGTRGQSSATMSEGQRVGSLIYPTHRKYSAARKQIPSTRQSVRR